MQISANTEVIEKKVNVDQSLSRMRRPLDLTTINVEVYGVYSLPEQWKQKIAENDPSEQAYQYELEVCGMSMKSAKVFSRELTEEEKTEQAAAANAKGAKQPPAPAKDAKKGPEEPSKEEAERLEKEKRDREEKDRKLKEEWDSLDEDTRFYRTSEDIYKQPCIKFQNVVSQKKIEALQAQIAGIAADSEEAKELHAQIGELQSRIYTGNVVTEKQGFELVEFEEWVQKDKGCWVRFMKLPPLEDAAVDPKAAAAKGAPAKGAPKAGGATEMKPQFGRAWISFDDLLKPGALETKQRIIMETCPPMVKKAGEDGVERWVQSEEPFENLFESTKTYVYIKLTLTDPVTPTIALEPEPLPQDVVPVKQFIRWPFSKIPTDDFRKQINLAVESLAKEYYTLFHEDLLEEQHDRLKSENQRHETFEERKKEFLYEINTSGKYHIMKEKMKKTIVRIVREHFMKQDSEGIKGIYKDERDHFYSQLYAYLVSQMRATVSEIVQRKKDELHQNISVPKSQFTDEKDRLITQASPEGESLSERYARLAYEFENLYCYNVEAEQFMLKYQALHEGDYEKMLELGRFYLRNGKLDKADKYLRDTYSFQIKNPKIGLMYAGYLLQLNRTKEAIVILNKLANEKYEPIKVNLLLSLAYETDQDPLLAHKYKAIAFVYRLRELELVQAAGTSSENKPLAIPPHNRSVAQPLEGADLSNKSESTPGYNNQRLNSDQEDELYISLAETLSQDSICLIAKKVMSLVKNQETSQYQLLLGSILFLKRNFEEAIKPYQHILSQDDTNLSCICNIGHCYYMLRKFKEAEEYYIRALRVGGFSGQPVEDPLVLQRLGWAYNLQKQYSEASVIFEECYVKYRNSFSLKNYGITQIYDEKTQDYEGAIKYLTRANQLNPYNADIWGYIVYASLLTGKHIQAFQAQKEALKLKISNVDLLNDIAKIWLDLNRYQEAKEVLETAMKSRIMKQSAQQCARNQKKLDEFMKAIESLHSSQEEMKAKFREIMVKGSSSLKEDDWIINHYILTLSKLSQ